MKPEISKYLLDILGSIDSIYSFLGDTNDFNVYLSDKMLRRAVEREFEILGEAMNRISKADPEIQISSSRLIIGMRNRVIHGYDAVDDEIVWGTIQRHLPLLRTEIQKLLKQ